MNISINSDGELSRLQQLAELDLDPIDLENDFENFTKLASQIVGTKLSLLNLIDVNNLWTFSGIGIKLGVTPIEHSICRYTILEDDYLEVKDLTIDDRFKDIPIVKEAPYLKYYFGLPLKTSEGVNIGSLCVIDTDAQEINPEKISLLKLIAAEVTAKLETLKSIDLLKRAAALAKEKQRLIAHGLRNPLAGIIGLSDVLLDQFDEISKAEVKEYISLINESSKSVLASADEVIIAQLKATPSSYYFTLKSFKERLLALYHPLLVQNDVQLQINIDETKEHIHFLRNKVLNMAINLLSDAIKNGKPKSQIQINLDIQVKVNAYALIWKLQSESQSINENPSQLLVFTQQLIEQAGGKIEFEHDDSYQFILPLDKC